MSDYENDSDSNSDSSAPLSPSSYSSNLYDSFSSTKSRQDASFLASEGLHFEGSVDLDDAPPDALALVSNAIKARKNALTFLGALSPSPGSVSSPSEPEYASCREALISSLGLMKEAISLCGSKTYPVLNSYLTFHTFHNVALTLSHPNGLGLGDGVPGKGEAAGLALLLAAVKAYDFDKMFSTTKQYDHIDYFLSGIWTGAAVLKGGSLEMLKKYRAKTITSFQKLSIRSHYDYSQIYLECLFIVFCPLQTMVALGETSMAGSLLKAMGFDELDGFLITYDVLERNEYQFMSLLTREQFELTVKLLLFLCDELDANSRTDQSWIPSDKKVIELNATYLTRVGCSVLDLPCLVCLAYEKLGRYDDAENLADSSLPSTEKSVPKIVLRLIMGRVLSRKGATGEAVDSFNSASSEAEEKGLKMLAELGGKEVEKCNSGKDVKRNRLNSGESKW
ncbi:hypothetical protein TrLO_g5676 [Triparma laevis f. longispina]|uniref:Uncharacterized protein n=1 Tax=Triparma laevis f. longispina TaxID=1714387 RepID=A0A9W7CAR1_9STRA|nr:hypothetical protein TrLO_g5676 [Triparma laevis f. longispina]